MKRGLYKSAAGSYKRRIYNLQSDPSMEDSRFRMYRSLPGTPMRSIEGTPSHSPTHSPTSNRRRSVFEFQSRGPTPRSYTSPISIEDGGFAEERSCQGLASIFKPQPRYIRANTSRSKNSFDNWDKLSEEWELLDDLAIGDIQSVVLPGSG